MWHFTHKLNTSIWTDRPWWKHKISYCYSPICFHALFGIFILCISWGHLSSFFVLFIWYGPQYFMYICTCCLIIPKKYLECNVANILSLPRCPAEETVWMLFVNPSWNEDIRAFCISSEVITLTLCSTMKVQVV